MKSKEAINKIGQLIYRRDDYIAAMEKDSGLSRQRIRTALSMPDLPPEVSLMFKGFCMQEADKLEDAAKELRQLARVL